MKLQTTVDAGQSRFGVHLDSHIMMLGSCFADEMGQRLLSGGFNVCVNPFGTLYNPVSILNSLRRLDSVEHFTQDDAVQLGSGSDHLWCSYSQHTSAARESVEQWLNDSNASLDRAASAWRATDRLIITLGTSWVWEHQGRVVSNCLKRPAREFTHRPLSLQEEISTLREIISIAGAQRRVIFTVSPIRHLWNGAHSNQLSKSSLLLSVDSVLGETVEYFPAYEIMLDELRDYRFYGEDMTHPTATAVGCIWEHWCSFAGLSASELESIARAQRLYKASAHRPLR